MSADKRLSLADWAEERWWLWVIVLWLIAAGVLLAVKWHAITWFALGDTDDNMRMSQVRALLHGQGWYDLRQYRLDPPNGANIHWTRFVDLPIAGLILLLSPFIGGAHAEMAAVAIAPLLPLLVAMFGLALAARRLIVRWWGFAIASALLLICAQTTMLMFNPLRIDHHGWQLAMLIWSVAGLADRRGARGGAVVGATSALSLTIGLELLPYVAMGAAATALRWVWDRQDRDRLMAYGAALAAGSAIGFVLFASEANRQPVCDALSPVWLSVSLGGGGLLVLISLLPVDNRALRLLLALVAGAAVTAGYALAWPGCLGMLEGLSPELKRLWFSHVREARPLYAQGWRIAVPMLGLPLAGAVGAGVSAWQARREPEFAPWAVTLLFSLFACAMLLWQTRAGPSAQLLSIPGATALAVLLLPLLLRHRLMLVRVLGTVSALLFASGLWLVLIAGMWPEKKTAGRVARAGPPPQRLCPTLPAMRPIARLPAQTVFTFVDLGPRLITVTHHSAIAGPYHRNGAAILDVHHAFRGSADSAHAIMLRHGATLLLICPGMPEGSIYARENPHGFYAQLIHGRVPGWLQPVALPRNSPLRLWQVKP